MAESKDLLQELRHEIEQGRMLVVVGAGVSIAATEDERLASWTGLLRNGAERCVEVAGPLPDGWANRVLAEIDSGDLDELLSAAEKISRKLGAPCGPEYARWLRETVGRFQVKDPAVIEALAGLGLPLATTNYDGLLEEVTGRAPVTWREGARVERVIRDEEEAILHLHGYWEEPESVVLGIRSYEQVLGDAHAQTMLRAVRATRGLLFVGCGAGIADPDFDALLRWMRTVFEGSDLRHFQLCLEKEEEKFRELHPPEERLFPLPYGADHSCLAPFLRELLPARGSRSRRNGHGEVIELATSTPGLPDPPLCFGREEEIRELAGALGLEAPQPIPVLGPPGMGKTTVLLTVLHERKLAERFGGRRFYVDCAKCSGREELDSLLARRLGLESGLSGDLKDSPALLVLDHAEKSWETDPQGFEDLLRRLDDVEGLSLVVSLRGEERPVGPEWRDAFRIGPVELAAARDAFLAIAGERFRPDPDLDSLLEAVDRLPLAVEILARLAEGENRLGDILQRWHETRESLLRHGERPSKVDVCRELSRPLRGRTGKGQAARAAGAAPAR
ncbi:MAG TPA: SIR2 family protein [Thermoanaerobaculia bacterium]|nr:SIR2 family protein [Thermoanaerobaculia bacterium]